MPGATQNFATWLREKRKASGLTQKELAKAAGDIITDAYISNLETQKDIGKQGAPTRPSLPVVDALAKALRVPVSEARKAAGYDPGATGSSADEQNLLAYYRELSSENRKVALAIMRAIHEQTLDSGHPALKEGDRLKVIGTPAKG
jgi:transcriptional regulator with XRE-family HTH domain